MCSRNGIAFDGPCSWSFGNDLARISFDVDNSLSFDTDNCKNNFLVFGEGPIDDVNGSIGTAEKKFSITLLKQRQILLKFTL